MVKFYFWIDICIVSIKVVMRVNAYEEMIWFIIIDLDDRSEIEHYEHQAID